MNKKEKYRKYIIESSYIPSVFDNQLMLMNVTSNDTESRSFTTILNRMKYTLYYKIILPKT